MIGKNVIGSYTGKNNAFYTDSHISGCVKDKIYANEVFLYLNNFVDRNREFL